MKRQARLERMRFGDSRQQLTKQKGGLVILSRIGLKGKKLVVTTSVVQAQKND